MVTVLRYISHVDCISVLDNGNVYDFVKGRKNVGCSEYYVYISPLSAIFIVITLNLKHSSLHPRVTFLMSSLDVGVTTQFCFKLNYTKVIPTRLVFCYFLKYSLVFVRETTNIFHPRGQILCCNKKAWLSCWPKIIFGNGGPRWMRNGLWRCYSSRLLRSRNKAGSCTVYCCEFTRSVHFLQHSRLLSVQKFALKLSTRCHVWRQMAKCTFYVFMHNCFFFQGIHDNNKNNNVPDNQIKYLV